MLAATLAALALRVFHLGAQSLWVDEAFTWLGADLGGRLPLATLLENVHGPLYTLILHAWGAVAGDSEWALRAPSMLFGVMVVPALAWLAARWLGRETAVPAAWLAAGSPFLVWYSQEARNYMLLVLCACLAGAVLAGPVRRPLLRLVGYFLAAGAGLLANFSFALLGPLHLRWWLVGAGESAGDPSVPRAANRSRGLWRALGLVALAVLLALILLPWVPQMTRTWDWSRLHLGRAAPAGQAPLRGATTFHAAAIPFALHALTVGYSLGPALRELKSGSPTAVLGRHVPELVATTLVFGFLGLAGLRGLVRRRRLLDALLWLGVPIVVVSFFALRNFKVFNPRYLAVGAPLLLLVLAAGLADLRRGWKVGAGLAVGLLWAVSLAHLYFDPRYGKEDYRAAAQLVRQQGRLGEKVLALGAQEPIYYYYRGPLPVDQLWLGYADRPRRLSEELEGKLAGARGTWIVLSRAEDLDPGGVFARILAARHPEAQEYRFAGVQVWHVPGWGASRDAAP